MKSPETVLEKDPLYLPAKIIWDRYENIVMQTDPMRYEGFIQNANGLILEAKGPHGKIGELCYVFVNPDSKPVPAEITGFRGAATLLMAYQHIQGIQQGCKVKATGSPLRINLSYDLLGRVINAETEPIDGLPKVISSVNRPIFNNSPHVLKRNLIKEPLATGIRSIDACLTLGKGQRVGIFSGSGVGKSTLMGMIAKNTEADINVIALVGERGREVREFIEKSLGEEGLKRSVVVVAKADDTPLAKIRAAYVAITIAEFFRDEGNNVMLMMDSITRFARSQREIGLANGEPPGLGGFPPSVLSELAKLIERAGVSEKGSITGIYTVLVEADDINDPVSDAVRGLVDGHIVLSRNMAEMNHYPAVDVLASISRVMNSVVTKDHRSKAEKIREILASYRETYDLIRFGAYVSGSDPKVDFAIKMIDAVNSFLKQDVDEKSSFEETLQYLDKIFTGEKHKVDDNSSDKVEERFQDLLERINNETI